MKSIILKIDKIVYSTRIMGGKYEILKDNGNFFKDFDENYWEWWKGKVSYLDEKCDILTIYSDGLEIDSSLDQDKNREWSYLDIANLLGELQRVGISLNLESYDEENQILKITVNGELKEFGINKKIKFVKEEKTKDKKEIVEKEKKIIAPAPKGSLRDYFQKKTEEYTKS